MIEKNDEFLVKLQTFLENLYHKFSLECDNYIELNKLIYLDYKIKTGEDNEWSDKKVLDLSTMPNGNIFINEFSNGVNFSTNIKSINNLDLVYGSIRPYFKKAGFALDVDYIAGTVFSFQVKNNIDYLWILACISSNEFHLFTSANTQGTKMPIINWNTFVSYKLPYNENVINKFNNNVKPLFDIAVNKMKKNRRLKLIKEKLLHKYF